jgi:hypothetical protein
VGTDEPPLLEIDRMVEVVVAVIEPGLKAIVSVEVLRVERAMADIRLQLFISRESGHIDLSWI